MSTKGAECDFATIDPTRPKLDFQRDMTSSIVLSQENPLCDNVFDGGDMFQSDGSSSGHAVEELFRKDANFSASRAGSREPARVSEDAVSRGRATEVLDHHAEVGSDDPHRVEFVPECVEPDPHCVEPQESKSTAAARRIVPTFESEVEPESPRAPARLLNIPAASTELADPHGVDAPPLPPAKPARVRPTLVIDGASAVAIEAFGGTRIRNQRGESLGVSPNGAVSWGDAGQVFEAFGVGRGTAFRAVNGKFVSSMADGTMRADAVDIGADELFSAEVSGNTITLRASNGALLGMFTMDESVLAQVAAKAAPARPLVNTVESEVPARTPPRLINIPAAMSSATLPPKAIPAPAKARASEVPLPKPFQIDFGSIGSRCGESGVHRLMIPIPNPADRAVAKVRLEQDVEVAKISGVTPTGSHLLVVVTTEYRVSGTYELKVIVEFNGKSITGKANVAIKHNKPQPLGMSAIVGGTSEAEVPFMGQLWKASAYTARFEPTLREFRLTSTQGTMDAGAKVFPFRVIFMPKDPKPVAALLVVVFDHDSEYTVEVAAQPDSSAGVGGRVRRSRRRPLTQSELNHDEQRTHRAAAGPRPGMMVFAPTPPLFFPEFLPFVSLRGFACLFGRNV
jgi:hypothetical protein